MTGAEWLPLAFAGIMGLAMLLYAVLDGYDLGVGILLRHANDDEKDQMIASIGPFWDANETWLVLGVGILLTVFPLAHGIILTALYLPVAFMLIGLILRGVSFDFAVAAYQAAIDGLGVALGRHPLVEPDLKAGRLVVPFDFKMSSEFAYYLVYPQEAIRRRKIKAFRDWLMPLAELAPRPT